MSFSMGKRDSLLGSGDFRRASNATNTFFIRVVISDFLALLYMRFFSACLALLAAESGFFTGGLAAKALITKQGLVSLKAVWLGLATANPEKVEAEKEAGPQVGL